jgi:lambda repressor-like predicted transcriptional regulator
MKQGARQVLPHEECLVLRSLSGAALRARVQALHQQGWSLAAIGNAFDPPRRRSTIRTWIVPHNHPPIPNSSSDTSTSTIVTGGKNEPAPLATPAVPPPPSPPSPLQVSPLVLEKRRRVYDRSNPKVSASQKRKLSSLAPLARRYRARTNPNGTYARANQELTDLCKDLYRSGASVRELSLAAGVTYRAMARRLGK